MLLDCRDQSRQFVPLDTRELRVVIVNSMVRHELSEGEYGKRRQQCAEGVRFFQKSSPGVRALRDVTMADVEAAQGKLSDVIFRRCRHVVSEIARTTEAAAQLGRHNYEDFGELMGQSHRSLRDDYEVSAPELDYLVEQAITVRGVYGARMTGGGFGGCIVALAQPRAVDPLREHLQRTYPERFRKEPAVFVTVATAGASVLE
jgi:galactokinase